MGLESNDGVGKQESGRAGKRGSGGENGSKRNRIGFKKSNIFHINATFLAMLLLHRNFLFKSKIIFIPIFLILFFLE